MEDLQKEFVPYELALKLKELGFYCDCFGDYFKFGNQNPFLVTDDDRYRIEEDNEGEDILRVPAPTFSQAFRWLREKYLLFGYPFPNDYQKYGYRIVEMSSDGNKELFYDWGTKDTVEEAELSCLDKLISIVESKSE